MESSTNEYMSVDKPGGHHISANVLFLLDEIEQSMSYSERLGFIHPAADFWVTDLPYLHLL